jgi:hypothetical protein
VIAGGPRQSALPVTGVIDDLVRRGLIAMRDDQWESARGWEVEVSVREPAR